MCNVRRIELSVGRSEHESRGFSSASRIYLSKSRKCQKLATSQIITNRTRLINENSSIGFPFAQLYELHSLPLAS